MFGTGPRRFGGRVGGRSRAFPSGGDIMAVARGDEGSSNVARKKPPRKPPETGAPPTGPVRLDDLYRLAMPRLFALAEREGIAEHTGMNRGQLIVGVVRRQIERGEVVRGSGTLEVLPD